MAISLPQKLPNLLASRGPVTVVDIGHQWVRMARYAPDMRMLSHAHSPTPEGSLVSGVVVDPGALSITLAGLIRDMKLRDPQVAVSYGDPDLTISPISLPRLSRKDLESSGGYYLEDQLLITPDETSFDILYSTPTNTNITTPSEEGGGRRNDDDMPLDIADETALAVYAPRPNILGLIDTLTAARLVPTHLIPLTTALPHAAPDAPDNALFAHIGGSHLHLATCTKGGILTYGRISPHLRLAGIVDPGQQPQFLATLAQEVNATSLHIETSEGEPIRNLVVTGPGARIPGLPDRLAMECDLNLHTTLDPQPVNPAPLNPATHTPNQPDYAATYITAKAISSMSSQEARNTPTLSTLTKRLKRSKP